MSKPAKKIFFATTAHSPFDDRIFYHQAQTLAEAGHQIYIFSTAVDGYKSLPSIISEGKAINNTGFSNKKKAFFERMEHFDPDVIIASEPFAVFCAKLFSRRSDKKISVAYDITEWYPSKKNLRDVGPILRPVKAVILALFNMLAGHLANAFIFGELSKMVPFSTLYYWKKHILQPYYPSKKYISYTKRTFLKDSLTLCYTGNFTKEKGFGNFIAVAVAFQAKHPEIETRIKCIGSAPTPTDKEYSNELLSKLTPGSYTIEQPASFETFTEKLQDVDICFDLRSNDTENTHCLPIKIFYYMACGKPVIYTNLKALRKTVPVAEFGFLCNPTDTHSIVRCIENYLYNPMLYDQHASKAREFFLEKYNWEKLAAEFNTFINKL